ncbi:MAG: AMP-binding protein [Phycisphaeraceae bacterium]|nr:AMP-binding protein [Phycisphaeraceae bacterium]
MSRTRSYVHRGGEQPLLGVTVDEMFRTIAGRFPQREAIVCIQQDERLRYADLDQRVDIAARALLAMGVARGDRVGVWSTDNVEWVVLQLATARVGAVLVNINPAYRVAELRHALRLAEVNAVFLIPAFRSSQYVRMLLELIPEAEQSPSEPLRSQLFPNLRLAVVWDPDDRDRTERWAPGLLTWREFLDRGDLIPDSAVKDRALTLDPDDPINIQFTSGTTGFPKAVVLTHHNIVNNAFFTARAMGFTEQDRLCVPLPFYHCFGMVVSNLVCLSRGACIVVASDHFEAGATLRAIERERCTAIHGVPTMFAAELDHPEFDKFDTSSLRTGIMAGAPCPPELMRRVIEDMGCREILIGYGQTESSPIATLTQPTDSIERRLKTVGMPIDHQQIKVVDHETGRVLPVGEQGEVCIRGYNVMRQYYAQPEATRDAIDEGRWLHTGDLGVMDEDGYIAITGRLKDMIIRGGENIYPAEIEAFFFEHPGVEQVAVFGCPHESYGEEVGAWVRMRPGVNPDAESLREYARGKIAHYKVPTHIWFVDEFPTTVTGKIQKNRMAQAVVRWREAGGESAPWGVERYIPSPAAPTR